MTRLKSRSVLQFSILTAANFGTILLALVTNIIMTNILSESDYGSYRYIINVIIMIVSFSNIGVYYSSARLLAVSDKNREKNIYGATLAIVVFISIIVGMLSFIGYLIVGKFIHLSDNLFVYALPLIFTVMLQRTFMYMLRGSNRIFDISIQTILPQLIMFVIYVALFATKIINFGFELALYIYAVAFLITDSITIIRLKIPMKYNVASEVGNIFREQKINGFEIYKGSLISVFSADFLSVFIGAISQKAEYAIFTLALSLSSPIIQIPVTMGVIHFKKNANSKTLNKKQILTTFILGIIAYLGLNLIIHILFPIIYKDRYSGTLLYVAILSLGFLFHGIGDYFNNFLNAQGKGKSIKRASIICGITQLIIAICLIPLLQIFGLVIARVVASFLYFAIMYNFYHRIAKYSSNNIERGE